MGDPRPELTEHYERTAAPWPAPSPRGLAVATNRLTSPTVQAQIAVCSVQTRCGSALPQAGAVRCAAGRGLATRAGVRPRPGGWWRRCGMSCPV